MNESESRKDTESRKNQRDPRTDKRKPYPTEPPKLAMGIGAWPLHIIMCRPAEWHFQQLLMPKYKNAIRLLESLALWSDLFPCLPSSEHPADVDFHVPLLRLLDGGSLIEFFGALPSMYFIRSSTTSTVINLIMSAHHDRIKGLVP